MTDERDFTSYVTARWAQLVRCLVAAGAPLGAAHRGAAETLSSCHDDWDDRDEWSDLDVHVVRDLFDRWERRRDEWWTLPVSDEDTEALEAAGWPDLEARLDQLTPADRQALVITEVLGLGPDQVRSVTRTETRPQGRQFGAELHAALDLLAVDPPPIDAMVAASRQRRRRRRTASIAVVAAIAVVAGLVATLVVRHDSEPEKGSTERFATVRSVPYDNPSPIAWYAGGTFYLPHSQLAVRDVRAFAQWRDGAVYLDVRGNLLTVSAKGERARITTLGSTATFAVYASVDEVVWVDPAVPELVGYDLVQQRENFSTKLNDGQTQLIDIEGSTAYLATPVQVLTADLKTGDVNVVPDTRLPGELDRSDDYVLAREQAGSDASPIQLIDIDTGEPVPIDVREGESVSDARFGTDGSVMLLIEPPGGAQISEIRRCSPPFTDCRALAYFPSGGARPLLAH